MQCQSLFPTERSYANGNTASLIFNIILCISNLTANGSIMYALTKLRLIDRPSYLFYFSMSISDFLISLILQPMMAYTATFQDNSCTTFDVVAQVIAHTLCEFSGLMIMLIAIDRHFQMRRKENWHVIMSSSRARQCIVACSGFCLIIAVVSALSSFYSFIYEFQLILSVVNGSITVIVMFVYIRGYCHLRNSVASLSTNLGLRVAKYITIILVIMAVCYIPTFIAYPMYLYERYAIKSKNYKTTAAVAFLVSPLIVINSFLSAVVLINSSNEIRGFFKQKIDTLFCLTNRQANLSPSLNSERHC